jgi:hypothetical protein
LLALGQVGRIPILTAAQCLARLEKEGEAAATDGG